MRSIRAMLVCVAMFSIMDATMKLLSAHFPAMQVAAIRALSALPLVGAYLFWRGGQRSLLRIRWPLHLLRGAIGIAMLSLFTYGLKTLSLAQAYSIFFIGPILVTALSVFVLGERVDAARWIAIVGGMAGVLVVLRPTGTGFFTLGGLAVLTAAVCYAVSAVSGRVLARTDRGEHMMFWLMFLMAIGATPLAAPAWVPVQGGHWLLILLLAISGFFGQLALTEAFSHGEASVVAPFEYTALAWGVAIDWALWNTLPDRWTIVGAAIIIASGVYLARREAVHKEAEHP
jgi:drug/metabolite transporter (DMT)-like permease